MPGGMHGGDAEAAPYVFFAVDDMDAALARVRELGGSVEEADVEGDEESVARFGRFQLCRDDRGHPSGCIRSRLSSAPAKISAVSTAAAARTPRLGADAAHRRSG